MDCKDTKRGSIWRRWDPHIHAPDTVLGNEFPKEDSWEKYLKKIENSSPEIEVLGITDYYSTECYKKVLEYKESGRLPNVKLIFPNVEFRYGIGTHNGSAINGHLLVSPEDPEHLQKLEQFLTGLTFKAGSDNETFRCTQANIIRLGKALAPNDGLSDDAAFKKGANQFKIEVDQFITEWYSNPWIQKNALIAVSGKSSDGPSGLQNDASLTELRKKIERISHIIFSSRPKDRDFWAGLDPNMPKEKLISTYNSCKPCIHGSDAHDINKVGEPDLKRYTWIKGDPTFESLRQACIEPIQRVVVSERPQTGALQSQTIKCIRVNDAKWFGNNEIPLNSGLVGIIGARGSGKTALADIIASGAYTLSKSISEKSFVKRAEPLLGDATVLLDWGDGSKTEMKLIDYGSKDIIDYPKVQYLSQQFVEQLCSASGATKNLLKEVHRVIFNSHPHENRQNASNFDELLKLKTERARQERGRHEKTISHLGEEINVLRKQKNTLPVNERKLAELNSQLTKDIDDRKKLVPASASQHAANYEKVTKAAENVRRSIEKQDSIVREIELILDHVQDFTENKAPSELINFKNKHTNAELSETEWADFLLTYSGNVTKILKNKKQKTKDRKIKLVGTKLDDNDNLEISLLPKNIQITKLSLSILAQEELRLQKLIGVDERMRKRHTQLSEAIRTTGVEITKLEKFIKLAENTNNEIIAKMAENKKVYQKVFDSIISEQEALVKLYEPLRIRFQSEKSTVSKLHFSVARDVNVLAWVESGKSLFDLRKRGFQGVETLFDIAKEKLYPAWKSGTSSEATEALAAFIDKHRDDIISSAKVDIKKDTQKRLKWLKDISTWLYNTDHISLIYEIEYEGVKLETLSPGTRGIVLLLLYLAIDVDDNRPLIIDQPEENLDPQSIFEELVGLFRETKLRRQIIIVTHNANLIVNTDAEQVIVAKCGPLESGKLPTMTYTTGSLEDPIIRKLVCDILEGGESAFQERAKRLRIGLV